MIYRGHTHLFTARDQLVNEQRLTVLGQLKVFSQLLVLQTGHHDQSWIENHGYPSFTSCSAFAALFACPSANCCCSAALALERRTSSSFERITHSKCRSRSSYWRRISLSRSRTTLSKSSSIAFLALIECVGQFSKMSYGLRGRTLWDLPSSSWPVSAASVQEHLRPNSRTRVSGRIKDIQAQ